MFDEDWDIIVNPVNMEKKVEIVNIDSDIEHDENGNSGRFSIFNGDGEMFRTVFYRFSSAKTSYVVLNKDTIYLHDFCSAKSGYGTILLQAVIAWAKEKYKYICLIVANNNQRAVRLYTNNGFVATEDEVLKPLSINASRVYLFQEFSDFKTVMVYKL